MGTFECGIILVPEIFQAEQNFEEPCKPGTPTNMQEVNYIDVSDDLKKHPEYAPSSHNTSLDDDTMLDEQITNFEDAPYTNSTSTLCGKRKSNPENWQKNIIKKARQAGLPYTNVNGKQFAARKIQENLCRNECSHKCQKLVNKKNREIIHKDFWNLNDEQKCIFYSKFVQIVPKARNRNIKSKRQNTYKYFFEINHQLIQVCRAFFLGTINISAKRIHYFFKTKYKGVSDVPKPLRHGKRTKKNINTGILNDVRYHINSVPQMNSHTKRILRTRVENTRIKADEKDKSSRLEQKICGRCDKVVENDSKAVICGGFCREWYHQKCASLSNVKYEMIRKLEKDVLWICQNCKVFMDKIVQLEPNKLIKAYNNMEDENQILSEICTRIQNIEEKIEKHA